MPVRRQSEAGESYTAVGARAGQSSTPASRASPFAESPRATNVMTSIASRAGTSTTASAKIDRLRKQPSTMKIAVSQQ